MLSSSMFLSAGGRNTFKRSLRDVTAVLLRVVSVCTKTKPNSVASELYRPSDRRLVGKVSANFCG
jgi:hypothetical protein